MIKLKGANHLAYHMGALLAIHKSAMINKHPLPNFIFLDQPSQVYFPSEKSYVDSAGNISQTEQSMGKDTDMEKVRELFPLFKKITEEALGLQIIVSEHANLADDWFQNALIEEPWTKLLALVPENWEEKL